MNNEQEKSMIIERLVTREYTEDGKIWLPPDKEQEFIRCKDCRHYDGYVCKHEVDVRSRKPEWYCADAWKRE